MKVLSISRYLPIVGFPVINDITLKIYANLRDKYRVESLFIMPLSHMPKWSTYLKGTLKNRYKIIQNKNYYDKQYNIPIHFFEGFFGYYSKIVGLKRFHDVTIQFPFYKRNLYKHIKKFNPDLVHAHTMQDAFYAYKIYKKFGISYIITLRGTFNNFYRTRLIKKVLDNAQKVVTPSARLKSDLDEFYDVDLLPHGVDKKWYFEGKKEFDSNTLHIITVASLIEMKNIQLVIKSVSKLIKKGHKIQYSIVGEGEYQETLMQLVEKEKIEDAVTFHGFLTHDEIRKLYNSHDVFVMLSFPETFGRVYFEAAAQGLLIIGRKGTGMDGYFDSDEAFTIEANEDEVCEVLKIIDKSIFDKMTIKSRQRIEDFKNDKIIKEYNKILISANQS